MTTTNDHTQRAAEMLEELEAIEQDRKDEAERAERAAQLAALRAQTEAHWRKHRASLRASLEPLVAELLPRASNVGATLYLREEPAALELRLREPGADDESLGLRLAGVEFEERALFASSYSSRVVGTKRTARLSSGYGGDKRAYPLKRDGSFSYDKMATEMAELAAMHLHQRELEQRAATVRANHEPTFRALVEAYGLSPRYGSANRAYADRWHITEGRPRPAFGSLDVELELRASNAHPFGVRLPAVLELDEAQARELLDLLARFYGSKA